MPNFLKESFNYIQQYLLKQECSPLHCITRAPILQAKVLTALKIMIWKFYNCMYSNDSVPGTDGVCSPVFFYMLPQNPWMRSGYGLAPSIGARRVTQVLSPQIQARRGYWNPWAVRRPAFQPIPYFMYG